MCVCTYVCVYVHVCVYVCPLISAASHIGITKQRYQRIHRNTEIILNFLKIVFVTCPMNTVFDINENCYAVIHSVVGCDDGLTGGDLTTKW